MSPSADRELKVKILGDSSGANKAFNEVDKGSTGLAGSLGKLGGVLAATFAADKIIGFVKGGIDSLANMDRIVKQTESVVKSTGGAAGVTADQVSNLADSIERATGVEAENVQTGENMLLTFTNIKNGVGDGNDIFDQATRTMTDLATAMGGDTQGAAIQLGKALNDPTKGITALTKVGVTFTDQQKSQIEAMQKAGDTAGAQKVILAELNKEFGGSAEAFGDSAAGKIAKFKNELGNLQDSIVSAVLPALLGVTDFVTDNVGPALDTVSGAISGVKKLFSDTAAGAGVSIGALFGFEEDSAETDQIIGIIESVKGVVAEAVAYVQQQFAAVQQYVAGIMPQVRGNIDQTLSAIRVLWATFGDNITAQVKNVFGFVQEFVKASLEVVQGIITTVTAIINGDWGAAWDGIKQILSGVWDAIFAILRLSVTTMQNLLGVAWDLVKAAAGVAWDGLKSVISDTLGGVVGFMRDLPGRMIGAVGDLGGLLKGKGSDVIAGLRGGISSGADSVLDFVRGIPGRILGAMPDTGDLLRNAGDKLIGGFIGAIRKRFDDVKNTLGSLTDKLPSWKGPPERDEQILRPAGQKVIGGFVTGLWDEFPTAKRDLGSMTDQLAMAGGSSSPNSAGGSSGPSVVNHWYITAPGAYAEPITEDGLMSKISDIYFMYGDAG